MEPNEEIKYVDSREPDISNDTDKIKEVYNLLVKVKDIYMSMTEEEKERMDKISTYFFGE